MATPTTEKDCPICEQIVQAPQKGVVVKVSPARTIMVHDACAMLVIEAFSGAKTKKDVT